MQIKVNNISHTFEKGGVNEITAIKDINTKFTPGEFITIIGESGSGKTTFIEHLNGLLIPETGEVQIGNRIITSKKKKLKWIKEIRKRIGIVFQFAEYQLFEETILKDIIFGPVSMGIDPKVAKLNAEKYIKLVGMDESFLSRSPFQLSGGQKRRVALAGILAMEPDYLIFDEPTAGLDPHGEVEMYKIFKKLNQDGKTIIIVTHNMDHVLEHSERTIVFKNGKIVEDIKSLDMVYDEKKMKKNNLQLPKLVSLVNDLEKRGKKIGKVRTIEQLVNKL